MYQASKLPLGSEDKFPTDIYDQVWRPDGKYFAVACSGMDTIHIFNNKLYYDHHYRNVFDAKSVIVCKFSRDGRYFAHNDGKDIVVRDGEKFDELWRHTLDCEYYTIDIEFTPGQQPALVVWGWVGDIIKLFDMNGNLLDTLGITNNHFGRHLSWIKKKRENWLVVSNRHNNKLEIYRMERQGGWHFGEKEISIDIPSFKREEELLYNPINKCIYMFFNETLICIDIEAKTIVQQFEDVGYIWGRVAFDNTYSRLVWGFAYHLRFLDIAKNKIFGTDHVGSDSNRSVAFSPSGELLSVGDRGCDLTFLYLQPGSYLETKATQDNKFQISEELISVAKIKAEITGGMSGAPDLGIGGELLGFSRPPEKADGAKEYREIDLADNIRQFLALSGGDTTKAKNRLEKFKKILTRYEEIEVDDLAGMLKMDKFDLIDWLIDLPDEFGFKLNKNILMINTDTMGVEIDHLLDQFNEMEKNKSGKI
ncbi:MAG: WD40 repeat domain-containing protein [Candidatus Heimdallarchaeota archaeon]|nr:WD40 repeat domain-containing protein [Candidatus Heimdallarchaeota archaeon]